MFISPLTLLPGSRQCFLFFVTKSQNLVMNQIEFRIKRSLALRLEVLLADIAELYPDSKFSIENVLEIIYCDFIEAYKNGNLKNVVEKIIENAQRSI